MSNTSTVEKNLETKSNSQHSPTIRIQADLFEPTENRYPVFNYQKLLIEEKKRHRRDQQSNSFEENDESIKQLADHYEQKYGSSNNVKKKKKKKTAFYNYSELAAGYDENDSFIDNTEIFDEVMPKEKETEHGGYYVNSGSLTLKEVFITEDSEKIKSSQHCKPFRNSVLEDSDEKLPPFAVVSNNSEKNSPAETKTSEISNNSSCCSDEEKEISKLTCSSILPVNGKTKKRQSDSDSASSIIPNKKKKTSTVKPFVQEKRIQIPECKPSCSKDNQPIPFEEIPTTENNVNSISDTIESVISAACLKPQHVLSTTENDDVKNTQNVINTPISIENIPVSNGVHNSVEELPDIVVEIIESIKTEAQIAIQNNSNIFSEQINLYLLSLEYQNEITTFNLKSVYAILSEHMLCDQEKLVEQVNQLVNLEEAKISKPIERLKNSIKLIFPSVLEEYQLACKKVLDQRSVNGVFNDVLKSKPGPKRPRRKFPWNDEFRTYVREIISIRTATYSKIKRSEPIDCYVSQFINKRIKPLWPNGWMKSTNILKELKAKEKDSRSKLTKKQPLQNSPVKLLSAIKLASEHKVSNSAMNKQHKWNKQKFSKLPDLSTETSTISTSHTSTTVSSSTTSNFKTLYNFPHSVTISTLSNDICPYQATITTTAINGCKPKESDNNSVIVKTEALADDILDLSPNKSSVFKQLKDVTVICNNTSQDDICTAKTDLQSGLKHTVHQPISRKQRLLQELHNTSTHISTVDQQSTKPKDDKPISSSSKLDSIKVDEKSTAKDMLNQIINESLKDNTSPLSSQLTTSNFCKPNEETKMPSSIIAKHDIKKEYSDWQQNDWSTSSRIQSSHRSSNTELAEKESQELIRELLALNQLSSSCSSRNTKDNMYNKHSLTVPTYSSHSPDTRMSSPLGVIHHPAYRNSYSTTSNTKCKSRNESHGTTEGIPKMNIGFPDEFLKHMVKTEQPNSQLTTDNYQKLGIPNYNLLQTNVQSSDNLFQQQLYSTLNTKSNQDMSHNSITYSSNK